MSGADTLYRALLRAYPAEFRRAYEREMTTLFRDQRRIAGGNTIAFWFGVLWDVAKSAPTMRLHQAHAQFSQDIQHAEVAMLVMAILAMLVGAVEVVNSLIEVSYGGFQAGGTYSLVVGLLGTAVGALMVAAGMALIRGSRRAQMFARMAALSCLAVFVGVRAVQPIFSIFASMLGIGFPIMLLVFLRIKGGDSSRPMVTS